MISRKLILAAALVAASSEAASAQRCRTLDQVLASCDAAFSGNNPIVVSERGWCYLLELSCVL
ncbi:MAG: hypothetical protein ACJ79K_17740 [Gemmatimonadaceae bacterium]